MKECRVVLCFLFWILVIFLVPVIEGEACTTTGWFGDNCQYRCHCADVSKCDSNTGECIDNSTCVKGWFGPACQYVDLTTTETTVKGWLYDGDDTTCNPNNGQESVTVELNGPFIFTWLRLYVSDPEDLDSINVQFKTKPSASAMACDNKKTSAVNDRTLDIDCDLDALVQQVILTGQGISSLCSVYISGGRNVALKQLTSQSSSYGFGGKVSTVSRNAVDGNREGNWTHGSCTQTSVGKDKSPSWSVTFKHPQTINRYVLFNRQDAVPERFLNFTLTSYTEEGGVVFTYQDKKTEAQDVYTLIPEVTSTSPVSNVTIRATVNHGEHNKPVVTLCEVETYGDTVCPQGRYGRQCEHSCDYCRNHICFVSTGGCPDGCADGFIGANCQTPCQTTYWGQDCQQRCSTNCKDQLCDRVSGVCNQCPPGKKGDLCDQDCEKETHGQNCEETCSEHCLRPTGTMTFLEISACNPVNGICYFGCADGFVKPLCLAATQQESSSDFVYSVGIGVGIGVGVCVLVAVVVLGVYFYRKRVHNARPGCQQPPEYDVIGLNRQDEHNYMDLSKGNDEYIQLRDEAPAANENPDVDEHYEHIAGETSTGEPDVDYVNNVTKTSGVEEADGVYANCPDETKF